MLMQIRVLLNERGVPAHKLADAEIVFEEAPLKGLKLCGIAVWSTKEGGELSVTFPARSYQGEGGVRYFNFLRPDESGPRGVSALDPLKEAIRAEYRRVASFRKAS